MGAGAVGVDGCGCILVVCIGVFGDPFPSKSGAVLPWGFATTPS